MLIRAELAGDKLYSKIYDGIVETAADLTGEARLAEMSPGSLMYGLADGKVYAKNAAGEWVQAE